MSDDLVVRRYADADEEAVLALLQLSLGGGPIGQRTADFFRWKHRDNPFGRSPAFVAEDAGRLVGFRTFMRWRWRAGARRWEAVRAVDTATHPDHQGKGIFTRLTDGAVDGIRGEIDLIFNTPNDKSRPGYLKMGWTQVGAVPVALRPRRPLRFARGVRSARAGASDAPIACRLAPAADAFGSPEAVAGLLERVADGDGRLATDRSVAYLRWRYAEAPGLDYRHVAVHRGGELVGLVFARPRRRGPLAELTVSEVLVARGDRATTRALLREAGRGSGCDHLATVTGLDPDLGGAFTRAGFVRLPSQGIVLTTRPLADVAPDPTALGSWAFSLGDLEVF
ncbi:MAG TPA: GNAT family N-acetyltransferase [Iamia sp.]|nr:GNAT family N-acetyltransferase [Iamia sp.]